MQSVDCPFCEHANPPGAKFCNECGSPLHFAPCKQCGAVNRIEDSQCFRCGIALTAPHIPTQAAHIDPQAASALQDPMGLEQKAQWLEQELLRLQEPHAIAPEPRSHAEKHRALSAQRPGARASDSTEHEVSSEPRILAEEHRAISAQRPGELASGVIDHQVGSINMVRKKVLHHHNNIDHAATQSARRRRSLGPARVRLRTPEGKSLFSELAEEPRVRSREVAAGLSAALLMLTIAVGAYFYYLEKLAPKVAMAELGEPESAAPSRASRTSETSHTSVAPALPLTKGTPAPLYLEPNPSTPGAKVSGGLTEVGEGPNPTAATSSEAQAVAAEKSVSEMMPDAQCPPAVVAIALCDWFESHADRK